MPTISLSDGFGLKLQGSLDPQSAFAKYFQKLPSLSAVQQDLASLQNLPLTSFPLKAPEIGLSYSEPAALSTACPIFSGSAAAQASLCVVKSGTLFDSEQFDDPIKVAPGQAYLGLGVKISAAPQVNPSIGKLQFGFTVGGKVSLSHYQPFATTATTPLFKNALQSALQKYIMPLSPDDFSALGVGDVAVMEGQGSLEVSGTYNVLTSVNPLASISVAPLPMKLQIQEGAEVDVSATLTISGELQIRVQKLDANTVRLGFYRQRALDLSVEVDAKVGVSVGTGSTDYISTILGAVSSSPLPSAQDLKNAGLTDEKRDVIVSALKAAIQRKIELSLSAQLTAGDSREAAFLYEIKLSDLDQAGRAAIQSALKLNLSSLWNSTASLPRGIREIRNILTTTRTTGQTLKINLLGIYNFTSVTDLTLQGTVMTDAASGEILITDSATATRVAGSINYLADTDKLRKVLAQSFLITAAYRCTGTIAHAPTLKASYWHFSEHAQTDRKTMAAALNVLQGMKLIPPADAQQNLAKSSDFGKSTFHLSSDFDDALSQSLFLRNDGQPRGVDEFQRIGRTCLQLILDGNDSESYRLRALTDQAWPKVSETGGTLNNLAQVFPDLRTDSQIPIIAGDYSVIAWWSTTMAQMAQALAKAKSFLSQTPPPSPENPEFKSLQADLWRQMAAVAKNTHDRFSDPWGIMAMDMAANQKSEACAQLHANLVSLDLKRTQS